MIADPVCAEAECLVIGAMILDHTKALAIRAALTPADFHDGFRARVFALCCSMLDGGQHLDLVTLCERFQGKDRDVDVRLVCEMADSVANNDSGRAHAAAHAAMVADYGHRRRIIAASRKVAMQAGNTTDPAAMERAQSEALEMLAARSAHGPLKASEFADEVRKEVDAAQNAKPDERGLRTGIIELDDVIGGMRPGSLTILAARPSQGKSSFATTLISKLCLERGFPVGLFTVEVNRNDAYRNVACCNAKVSGHALMNGKMSDKDFNAYSEAFLKAKAAPFYVDDSPNLTTAAIRAGIRRLTLTRGLKLAIVDYLQILSPDSGNERNPTREREVAKMSANLKAAARESNIPVLVLAQLNREVEHRDGKRPRLSDLRESGSIEQDADIVMLLSSDWSPRPDHPEEQPPAVEPKNLDVAKNRNGPVHHAIKLELDKSCTRFSGMAGKLVEQYQQDFGVTVLAASNGHAGEIAWSSTNS